VTNPDGSAVTLTNGFTYIGPPPVILAEPRPTGRLWRHGGFHRQRHQLYGLSMAVRRPEIDRQRPHHRLADGDADRVGRADHGCGQLHGRRQQRLGLDARDGRDPLGHHTARDYHPAPKSNGGRRRLAVFTVAASGTAPFTYQWLLGGAPIPGATNSVYSVANVSAGEQGQQYSVEVSNPSGAVTSTAGTLTVLNYCTSAQPGQAVYPMGSTVPITVETFNCATAAVVSNSSAIVWISMGGTARSLPATTGPTGSTVVNFVPLPAESALIRWPPRCRANPSPPRRAPSRWAA